MFNRRQIYKYVNIEQAMKVSEQMFGIAEMAEQCVIKHYLFETQIMYGFIQ